MNLIIGAISIFGLGWLLNELTSFPTLVILAVCLAAQVGLLVANTKKSKK